MSVRLFFSLSLFNLFISFVLASFSEKPLLGEPRASWHFQDLEFLIPERRDEPFLPKPMSFTEENADWPCLDGVATSRHNCYVCVYGLSGWGSC